MRTHFTDAQLADSDVAVSNGVLRKCVHCGFCTATCPTYLLLGDELDSPRGRIVLIKDMLEQGGPPPAATVKHVDRCLSCLSCMTTCPSGVNYMHLVDHARAHIEEHHVRPWPERMLRGLLATVLPRRALFRWSMLAGRMIRPLAGLLPGRLGRMVDMAPDRVPAPGRVRAGARYPADGQARGRVALHFGCVQPVLRPGIDDATVRVLNRHGFDVVTVEGSGCCGALDHHMGREDAAKARARAAVTALDAEIAKGLDAIVITASGCGSVVKDYGFMLRDDPAMAEAAARVSALTRDVTEVLAGLPPLPAAIPPGQEVAYHSACSLQHGQSVRTEPRALLSAAGFVVREIGEGHICCGSAGTYAILQPELSTRLRDRKIAAIAATGAPIVATGNIGCITHLQSGGVPMTHVVELIDWASGGPRPEGLPAA